MPRFAYFLLDGTPARIDIPQERVDSDEWSTISRMGGVPLFDPNVPLSTVPHMVEHCTDDCKQLDEASGRIHVPPGAPPPYWFSEEHKSWAVLRPLSPPRPRTR